MNRLLRIAAASVGSLCVAGSAFALQNPEVDEITIEAPIVLLVDMQSGQTLYSRNADYRFIPASITKVMSAFVAFEMIKAGKLSTTQSFMMSEEAAEDWYRTGSTMFLEPGESVSVDNLLKGITSVSANDASIVLAEGAAGSVDNWVQLMNQTARELGMTNSHFGTPNGWPDDGNTFTSARDLEILAKALISRHPDLYARYFGKPGLRHNGFSQANHDPISGQVAGADGIKTGYTNQAGFGFVGSAKRDGTRLIMVVGAAGSEASRDQMSQQLIEWGFAAFDRKRYFDKGEFVAQARVQNGVAKSVALKAADQINVAIPKGFTQIPKLEIHYEGPLEAPIVRDEKIAELRISADGMPTASVPLLAVEAVEEAGPIIRIRNAFESWLN